MFASISVLTPGGISTAESVTGLKAAMIGILKPTGDAEKAFEAYGIQTGAAGLEANGFVGTMQQIIEATGGNKDALGALFPAQEAMVAVMALSADGGKGLAETLDFVTNSTGLSQEAFERYLEANPAEAFTVLKTQVSNLVTEIGEAFIPVLLQLSEIVLPWLEQIRQWILGNQELVAQLALGATAIAGIGIVLGPLLFILPTIVSSFSFLGTAMAGVAGVAAAGLGLAPLSASMIAMAAPAGALGVFAFAVFEIAKAYTRAKEAQAELVESQKSLELQLDRLIQKLKDEGAEIDALAFKRLSASEQSKIIADEAEQRQSELTQSIAKELDIQELNEKQLAQARFVRGNNFISETESVLIAIKDLTNKQVSDLASLDQLQTESQLVQLGIREESAVTTASRITIRFQDALQKQRQATREATRDINSSYGTVEKKVDSVTFGFLSSWSSSLEAWKTFTSDLLADIDSFFGRTKQFLLNLFSGKIGDILAKWILGGGGPNTAPAGAPGFASGGVTTSPIVKVGERGPELALLPVGTNIVPAQQTQDILSGGNRNADPGRGGIVIEAGAIVVNVSDTGTVSENLANDIANELVALGRG